MDNALVRILRVLIEGSGEAMSIRKASRLGKMDYKTAYTGIGRLEKEGLVRLEKLGNTTNCRLVRKPGPLVFWAEYGRRKDALKDRNIGVLQQKLGGLPFPLVALLFGSYARMAAGKGSDIDLLVVCEEGRNRGVEAAVSVLPLKVHLTLLTPEQFVKMAMSREFSVVSEATKLNVILVGIEDYYRLVERAG